MTTEDQQRAIGELQRQVEHLTDRLNQVSDLVRELRRDVANTQVAQQAAPAAGGAGDHGHDDLADRLAAVEDCIKRGQWDQDKPEDLATWVAQLRTTYDLDARIPSDWERIASVTEELVALRQAHRAAFGPKAVGNARLVWHDHLARTLVRIDAHQSEHRKAAARRMAPHLQHALPSQPTEAAPLATT